MAVLPGSLDYLYDNGILDRIPYEAYQAGPVTPSGYAQMSGMGTGYSINQMPMGYQATPMQQMNGTQYLQSAQSGLMYNTYTAPDTFVRRNNTNFKEGEGYSISQKAFNYEAGVGRDADMEIMANGQEGKNFRQAIEDAAAKTKETVSNSPNWIKGLLAGGIVITTLCCLLKRGKKPALTPNPEPSFWAKLNPFNWFKK